MLSACGLPGARGTRNAQRVSSAGHEGDQFVGGGVVYSLRARDVLFDLPREAYKGMRGASEEYALLQARAIRDNFGADWGIAESGSVGGSSHPTGAPAGHSVAAVAGPDGFEFAHVTETGSDDRIANMEAFTRASLETLESALANLPA